MENRKRFLALAAILARYMKQNGQRKPQRDAERHEVPESGKPEHENQAAADGEEQTDEATAEAQLVHGDAGVGLLRHGNLVEGMIPLTETACNAL